MKVLATFLIVLCLSGVVTGQSGTLAVQLVEPGWLPIPEMTVTLVPVATCTAARGDSPGGGLHEDELPTKQTRETDSSGVALFTVSGSGLYRIAIARQDDFAARSRCIRLFDFAPPFETAYVQLRLVPAGPRVVVNSSGRRRRGGR